jgi:NAD(P)-dependent dehydrogenase (short-subunit alcohol dehydrogenase family)
MAAARGRPVSAGEPGPLLAGRLAVVTGGASGLGAAIAARLAAAGAAGIVIDQDFPANGQVPAGWTSAIADVRDPAALAAAFGPAGSAPQVVVACAGVVPPWTSVAGIDAGQWEDVFAVNVRGVMLTIREAVRRMGERGGAIVAISSLNGWKGDPHLPSYTASKHAVVGLVRSAALDVGRQGIRVNAVAPGPIATSALRARMAGRAGQSGPPVEEALRQAGSMTALGRIATEAEVADAVLFLASDMSSGITGQLLAVDAGLA